MAGITGFGSASAADTPKTVVTVQAGFIPVTDVAALYLGEGYWPVSTPSGLV